MKNSKYLSTIWLNHQDFNSMKFVSVSDMFTSYINIKTQFIRKCQELMVPDILNLWDLCCLKSCFYESLNFHFNKIFSKCICVPNLNDIRIKIMNIVTKEKRYCLDKFLHFIWLMFYESLNFLFRYFFFSKRISVPSITIARFMS